MFISFWFWFCHFHFQSNKMKSNQMSQHILSLWRFFNIHNNIWCIVRRSHVAVYMVSYSFYDTIADITAYLHIELTQNCCTKLNNFPVFGVFRWNLIQISIEIHFYLLHRCLNVRWFWCFALFLSLARSHSFSLFLSFIISDSFYVGLKTPT